MTGLRRPPVVGTLLTTQLLFNVGFYAVVPFLAVVLRDDYALGGAAIGLVLGVRTAAQQGLFLLGGMLTDLLGGRRLILAGCAVRVSGFTLLAVAPDLLTFVAGTVLTGLGGALFSPALQTMLGRVQRERTTGGTRRGNVFALLAVLGETGAVLGPLLGALALGWGFAAVAATGAVLFVGIGLGLALLLPPEPRPAGRGARPGPDAAPGGAWPSLRDRRFVAFAVVQSVGLLSYNQLYLGVPVEIERAGAGPGALAVVFAVVSAVTLLAQLPVARLAGRLSVARALVAGYLLLAAGFAVLALAAPLTPPSGLPLLPVLPAAVLLTTGHLVLGPTVLALVPTMAGDAPLGTYYGLLATCGGLAVLVGNVALGPLYDLALAPAPAAVAPWACLALLPLLPAALVPRLVTTPSREDLVRA